MCFCSKQCHVAQLRARQECSNVLQHTEKLSDRWYCCSETQQYWGGFLDGQSACHTQTGHCGLPLASTVFFKPSHAQVVWDSSWNAWTVSQSHRQDFACRHTAYIRLSQAFQVWETILECMRLTAGWKCTWSEMHQRQLKFWSSNNYLLVMY